jgi:hypothetical protein
VLDLFFVRSMMTVRCHIACAALELDALWLTEFFSRCSVQDLNGAASRFARVSSQHQVKVVAVSEWEFAAWISTHSVIAAQTSDKRFHWGREGSFGDWYLQGQAGDKQ